MLLTSTGLPSWRLQCGSLKINALLRCALVSMYWYCWRPKHWVLGRLLTWYRSCPNWHFHLPCLTLPLEWTFAQHWGCCGGPTCLFDLNFRNGITEINFILSPFCQEVFSWACKRLKRSTKISKHIFCFLLLTFCGIQQTDAVLDQELITYCYISCLGTGHWSEFT